MKVWVVHGYTGEYEDCREWTVIAYESKRIANKHAELAEKRALEIEAYIEKNSVTY